MKRRLISLNLVALLVMVAACHSPGHTSKTPPPRTRWVYPIAIPASQVDELRPTAERLAKVLRRHTTPMIAEKNPVCVFWLCVDGFTPNPGTTGYTIVIQPGGATITASTLEQLEAAVDKIESLRSVEGDAVYLPVGLITNYPIAHAEIAAAHEKASD